MTEVKIFENAQAVEATRAENKAFIFNIQAMMSAAKATLSKPVAVTHRTSSSGDSQVSQAIIACVSQAAALGTTQITMSQIKAMLSDGGVNIADKATSKKISDYTWNMSERNKNLKSVALLKLVKDASSNALSGIYEINSEHPSVAAAIAKAQAEEEVAE